MLPHLCQFRLRSRIILFCVLTATCVEPRWIEPVLSLSASDLQDLMNAGDQAGDDRLHYGVNIVRDTALTIATGGQARRTMLASDWLDMFFPHGGTDAEGQLWTHLHHSASEPREFGFEHYEG